jgi:hypothetical protein
LAAQYRRKGGNMYTYLFKVGNGMTHYLPAGHDNLEIMGVNGFDGRVGSAQAGDWDRYFAQVLFFLAGYNQTPCDTSCNGLPIVTAQNHLTGTAYQSTSIAGGYRIVSDEVKMHPAKMEFSLLRTRDYTAQVLDLSGKVLMQARGNGYGHSFNMSRLAPGVYLMRVELGNQSPVTKRYAISPKI